MMFLKPGPEGGLMLGIRRLRGGDGERGNRESDHQGRNRPVALGTGQCLRHAGPGGEDRATRQDHGDLTLTAGYRHVGDQPDGDVEDDRQDEDVLGPARPPPRPDHPGEPDDRARQAYRPEDVGADEAQQRTRLFGLAEERPDA